MTPPPERGVTSRRSYLSYLRIASTLPIRPGATWMVESDLRGLMLTARRHGERFDPDRFLDTLKERLGPDGTLLIPATSTEFMEHRTYDVRTSEPNNGTLPRCALRRADFHRTQHPTHSFFVCGARAEELAAMSNTSAWGPDSPFAFLASNPSFLLVIGLHFHRKCAALCHYAEEQARVPYRAYQTFTGHYTDATGTSQVRTYSVYLPRPTYQFVNDTRPLGARLALAGLAHHGFINETPFWTVDLQAAYPAYEEDARLNNAALMFRTARRPIATRARMRCRALLRTLWQHLQPRGLT